MSIYGNLRYDVHGNKRRELPSSKIDIKPRPIGEQDTTISKSAEGHRDRYPSGDCFGRETAKKEENVYTGSYIKGIATMHKSNSVPVGSTTDPKEFATMRRS